jgi:hypothetical protein
MARSEPTPDRDKPERKGWSLAENPLWPLEELRNLRFVADPEFSPLALDNLRSESPASTAKVRASRLSAIRREFPIPHLVTGLPWCYIENF